MNSHLKALASLMLATALVAGQAQTTASGTTRTTTKTAKKRAAKKPVKPSLATQIEQLRTDMQNQIQGLKQQLSERDQQLNQAQQAASAAQAAAARAQEAADSQQKTLTDNSQAVSNLEGAVSDLKTNTTSLVTTIQEDQTKTKAAIENPTALHYKGINLTPGGFVAAETVWRSSATGGDIPTAFSGLPFDHTAQGHMSEFYGTARQSRLSLMAEGKLSNATLRGYYEADFLGTGITSNNNQSNSYVMRQRTIWAQAELQSGWTLTGGQMWSLATEAKKGLSTLSGDVASPQTIDPNYVTGFVWARQYGFRVTKKIGNSFFMGASVENPETLNVGGRGFPTNFLIGSGGTGGGNYNSTANYSFNLAPDVVAKIAFEPGFGHYEVYGIGRFFRNRVYPNYTATTAAAQSAGAYNDSTVGGAVGGSFRIPIKKLVDIGAKGQWGQGAGRYGDTTLADTTIDPFGRLALLHSFSGIGTVEVHATPRLDVYFNYGGDYVGRRAYLNAAGKPVGYGSRLFDNSGCNIEPLPGSGGFSPSGLSKCAGDNRDVQEGTVGYWYDFYKGPKGRLRQGAQYAHTIRQTWAGVGGNPQSNADMFWTSFRYYLP
ncbi:MAG TPA: hypothetical protein VM554_12395 [Acidisarcina sp.]|nr:hypothetical protein [Acidisarcina sp.]